MTLSHESKNVGVFTKVIWSGMAVFVGLIVIVVLIALSVIYQPKQVDVASSPSGYGTAYFYKNASFPDTSIDLFVRDNGVSSDRISIGHVSDWGGQGSPPLRAVWSQDGTVIAVKRGENDQKEREKYQWSHGYDFRQHKKIGTDNLKVEAETSNLISNLIAERGGEGTQLIPGNNNAAMHSRQVWPWNADYY